ncbi:MAG: lectin-like protein, partial [Natronomonas sp.]|nr:lectin-like protein [Natronomonas sp.]
AHNQNQIGWFDSGDGTNEYIVEYGGLNGSSSTTAQRTLTVDTEAPTLTTSSGSVSNTTASGSYLVDDKLTVTDPDGGTIDTATVSIDQGFDPNSDKLSVNTTAAANRGITGSYDETTGVLTVSANSSATVTAEDFQAVLRTVTYSFTGTSAPNESERTVPIRFTLDANQKQVTAYDGHYYEFVSDSVSWKTAKRDAENRSHLGLQGYLATLTSQEEDDEIHSQFSGEAWIGASDENKDENWRWVTGLENGTLFWKGLEDGSEQNGEYAGWNSGEPNGGEYYAEINKFDGWNDVLNGNKQGYLVEYGGLTTDSAITAQRNVTVDTSAPNVTNVTIRRTSGGGVVTTNDTIEVSATVTDVSSIQSVTASAIAFDAGTVRLADDGPNSSAADDVYSATFTVGPDPSEQSQSVTVTATDEAGNGGTPPGDLVYDSVTVNPEGTTDFRTVRLPRSFENPVVIAKPLESTSPGKAGSNVPNDLRGTPRVRNVQSTSFEIRVEEWSVQDDETHPPANVSYIVAEAGTTTLDGGTKVSAGTIELNENDGFQPITFEESLNNPVAFANVQTANDMDSVSTRDKSVDSNGFSSKIEGDQGDQDSGTEPNPHGTETLGYIAIEQGDSALGETGFTAGTRGNVDENLASINFGGSYPAGFVAAMQTNSGGEESYLRYDGRTDTGVEVRIEEDPVDNSDGHISNTVGYLAWNASTQVTGTRSNELSVDTSAPRIDELSASRTTGSPPVSTGD